MSISAEDKYLPCLLSRLCDDEPQSKIDRNFKYVSLEKIKEEIVLNISHILNSKSRPQIWDLNYNQEVVNSVLGFGLPDFCGLSNSEIESAKLQHEIVELLKVFEPRLIPSSISVEVDSSDVAHNNFSFSLRISAQFAVKALTGFFSCISYLDLESGFATVKLKD